jgi:ribonuclease P protein component
MTVFYLPRGQNEGLRVGFTVGRALGGAVTRNRMKRRLREAVRRCGLPTRLPADVVINPKKPLLTAEFSELLQEVERAFAVIERNLAPVRDRT